MDKSDSIKGWQDPDDDDPSPPRCLEHEVDMVWKVCPECGGDAALVDSCGGCSGWGGWFVCPIDGKAAD